MSSNNLPQSVQTLDFDLKSCFVFAQHFQSLYSLLTCLHFTLCCFGLLRTSSRFGKRKYHRGKRVAGVWVFCGIERESEKCFFKIVEDRSAATLIPIIKEHIKPGSVILSDCWKAYDCLEREGYNHLTVNHSIELKNSQTGACTNTIEPTWNAVKKSLPKTGTRKDFYDSYFAEYCVRKQFLKPSQDKFLTFLKLVREVYQAGQ